MEEKLIKHILKKDSSLSKKEAKVKVKKIIKAYNEQHKERDKERDFKFRKDFEEALNKESYQTLFNYVDGLGLDD